MQTIASETAFSIGRSGGRVRWAVWRHFVPWLDLVGEWEEQLIACVAPTARGTADSIESATRQALAIERRAPRVAARYVNEVVWTLKRRELALARAQEIVERVVGDVDLLRAFQRGMALEGAFDGQWRWTGPSGGWRSEGWRRCFVGVRQTLAELLGPPLDDPHAVGFAMRLLRGEELIVATDRETTATDREITARVSAAGLIAELRQLEPGSPLVAGARSR